MQTRRFPAKPIRAVPAALALLAVVFGAGGASGQAPPPASGFQYAAKFVCGRALPDPKGAPPVAPGIYYTAINVHNLFTQENNGLRKVFAVALPGERVGRISPSHDQVLKQNEAMEIDCPDILKRLDMQPGQFVKGFAIILSTRELDVVSVYTVANSQTGQVVTMALERVPARRP